MRKTRTICIVWFVLMSAALLSPFAEPLRQDLRTRLTIDLSLAYYSIALIAMLSVSASDWHSGINANWIRLVWSLAWLAYFIHVAVAFNDVHHWSHADAVAHTRERSGVGLGIFVSHLFTIVWATDVAWWWFAPATYMNRPAWLGWCLHGFLAFMAFNGAVLFEAGAIRWVGVAASMILSVLLIRRFTLDKKKRPPHIA